MRPLYPILIGVSIAAVLLSGCTFLRAELLIGSGGKEARVSTDEYTHDGVPGQKFTVTFVREGTILKDLKDWEWGGTGRGGAYAAFLALRGNEGLIEGADLKTIPPVAPEAADDATRAAFEGAVRKAKADFKI